MTRDKLLEHLIAPTRGDLSLDLSRHVLSLDFPSEDHARYLELVEKSQSGELSDVESAELADFVSVNSFLSLIQAKAQQSLQQRSPVA